MPVRILAWKPIGKGAVVGVCDILLGKALEVHGILVMASNGKVWVAFPGKPRIGADDKVLRDDRGKVRYDNILAWADRVSSDKFKHSVLAAVTAKFGDVLNGGAP